MPVPGLPQATSRFPWFNRCVTERATPQHPVLTRLETARHMVPRAGPGSVLTERGAAHKLSTQELTGEG